MIWFNILLLVIMFGLTYPICAASGWIVVHKFCTALGLEPKKYCRSVVISYGFVYLLMFGGSLHAAFSPLDTSANMLMAGFSTAGAAIALIMLGLASAFGSLEAEAKKQNQQGDATCPGEASGK